MPELNKRSLFMSREGGEHRDTPSHWRSLRKSPTVLAAISVAAAVLIALMLPHTTLVDYHNEVGSIWTGDTLRAPFAFPLYKEEEQLNSEMQAAADSVLPIFVATGTTPVNLADTIIRLAEAIAFSEQPPAFLSEATRGFLQSIPAQQRPERVDRLAQLLIQALAGPYRAGVLDRSKRTIASDQVAIRRGAVYEDIRTVNALYDSLGTLQIVEASLARRLGPPEATFLMELFYRSYRPTLAYSAALTQEAINNARDGVARSLGIVAEGEVIVARGERITESVKLKLNSFKRSRELRQVETAPWWQLVGNVLHVGILLSLALLYLHYFRQRIFHDNLQIGILMSLMLIASAAAWASRTISTNLPIEYLIPVPLVTMLLVILFDSRTAFYLTVTSCFLIAAVRGADYSAALAGLSAGVLSIYAVRDIRSRTQLFRAILYAAGGYAVAIVALSLGRGQTSADVGMQFAFAAINAIFSPVATFAMIMALENGFGIATDLKLVEFDNLNHPLLRTLADKAPGTYQHTLTISRLAESAATAVNANALLAKVGTLFHDIGKIPRAEYFVENQMGMSNKHDKMKPERSARIIRDHVIEGIELAREYGLPQRIIDFIPMHHGTTSIQYFLDKAREGNAEVDDEQFRYPGPRPQSRETGIAMLADAVEAATRALANPTRKSIEETVDRVIKRRFSEGQLDQCELTLADLTKIKDAFVKNLVGMSHPRIQYKNQEPDGTKPEPPPFLDDAFNVDADYPYAKEKRKRERED